MQCSPYTVLLGQCLKSHLIKPNRAPTLSLISSLFLASMSSMVRELILFFVVSADT